MYTEIQEFLVGKGTQKNEQRSLYPYISWILISLAPQRMYVVRVGPQRMLGPIIRVGWNKTLHLRVVKLIPFSDSVQFSSIAQSCLTLCDPMNCSMPGLPVHHQLPEFTQTHAHRIGDAIQPSHPLSSPSPPAPNHSQHQGLFQWVNPSHEVAKVLEFQLQHQSFQWTPRTDLL